MKNEIVETNYQVMTGQDFKKELSLSGDDISRVAGHLELVKEVVNKVLKEGKEADGDYGVIPGAGKKKVLFKAGSEKMMKLFGLGVRFKLTDKEMDRYENFASFSYEAEVYHLKSGVVLATCEGTANSWEKKYKDRAVYVKGVLAGREPTPICDILNTLKKMAQKRAMVGAVIIATAASDYFTQDEDEIASQAPVKKEAQKADSSRFQKNNSEDLGSYVAPLGKFKGKMLSEIEPKELTGYCQYMVENNPNIEGKLKEFVDNSREYLRSIK